MTSTMNFVNKQLIDNLMANYILKGGDYGGDYYKFDIIPDATVGYLRLLVQPYFDTINDANSIESLNLWINQFPKESPLYKVLGGWDTYNIHTVEALKQEIIIELLKAILWSVRIGTEKEGDSIYTPWDIKHGLQFTYDRNPDVINHLGTLFNISDTNDIRIDPTLPVTVTIGNNTFVHEMTYPLALGIIAFYNSMNVQHPLSIFGYDVPWNDKELGKIKNLEPPNVLPDYRANVGTDAYYFYDKNFFRGLLTAAEWLNVNPHTYINLTELRFDMNDPPPRVKREIPLNFN